MDRQLRADKQAIRAFLRTEVWTDEKLCALLAHAQDKLSMWSCCCLAGLPTANHALQGELRTPGGGLDWGLWGDHYELRDSVPLAREAEHAFCRLGGNPMISLMTPLNDPANAGEVRRRLIRPIIRAELRRRDRLRAAEREAALLSLAHPNRMRRVEVSDIELASEHCEDATADIAAAILHGATVEGL